MSELKVQPASPEPSGFGSRVVRFLRLHPILCLLLLSPGIPEYLTGSSSFAILTMNPVLFLMFVGLNMGLYGPGVILVREAMIRWRKGWASVFLLGFAYAIVEEGLDSKHVLQPERGTSRDSRHIWSLARRQL